MSEASASEMNRDDTSGVYAHRIGSSRQQTTSTPEFALRKTFLENNGDYTTEIRNSKRDNSSELDQNYDSNNRQKGIMMDRLGRTHAHPVYANRAFNDRGDNVYPAPARKDDDGLKGLETPRSIQWPETARSYPLGFEASHVMNKGAISQSRGQRAGDRQKTIETPSRQNSQNKRNSSNNETPEWANRLLTKDSSLLGKFQNVKEAIGKWTLRRISRKSRYPILRKQGPAVIDMFDYPTNTTSDPKTGSTDPLVTSGKEKTYNIAAYLSGIFVIFILVFPVIVIIAIFTDRPDLVQFKLSMKFNGSITENFNSESMKYNICHEINITFVPHYDFYGCNVTEFRNGSIIANVSVLFAITNFPYQNSFGDAIEKQFNNSVLDKYSYQINSTQVISYSFQKRRLTE